MKKGDLIKMSDGQLMTAVSDQYTYRFMDEEDHDMAAAGMGLFAGVYGGAIDVVNMESGRLRRLRISDRNFEVISESR